MLTTLHHTDILTADAKAHLTRATLDARRPASLHDHDFHELIWVQNGNARHHLATHRSELAEGDLLFIRPTDAHALQGKGDAALVVSITLHPDLIARIGARHPGLQGRLFWSDAAEPAVLARDSRQMADLNAAALRLERGRLDGLAVEAFLLPLLSALTESDLPLPAGAPDWLARACAAALDPRVFRDGAAGFARVAGRAHPHVSRTVRRYLHQSPSDYVNTQRMAFAARRLAGSTDSLAEIAAECGIPNLSHFHKLFRAQHGLTPAAYRRARQAQVVQPG